MKKIGLTGLLFILMFILLFPVYGYVHDACRNALKLANQNKDLDEIIRLYNLCEQNGRLNKKYLHVLYNNRGEAFRKLKQYDRAMLDYNKALKLNPKYAITYNNLAWLMVTAKDFRYRNGQKALLLSQKANK